MGGEVTMSDSTSGPDLFNMLADQFAERYRRGERPPLSEYTEKYPALAEQIRELFPALVAIEQFGTGAEQATGSFAAQPGAADPIPKRLGDYNILREIGRGGMGIVYEAVQESLGRHVALKVLPQHQLRDGTQLERFRREARAAAMLHHTNIVPVFGVGEDNGVHHYAMQYIKGQSLDAILHEVKRLRGAKPDDAACLPASGEDAGLAASVAIELVSGRFAGQGGAPAQTAAVPASDPPPPGEDSATHSEKPGSGLSSSASSILSQTGTSYYQSGARIGVQAAEALAYAHHHKLLHRDIKPSNLLLDLQGTVWVTDFGLAKAEGTDALTQIGDIVGTLRYMAPERFQGSCDARSDVYALGLTLYEMLTLEPAFAAAERARLIDKILNEKPPNPRELDPRIPRDLETITLKAMAPEPSDRYQTAAVLAEDLRRYLTDRPILARRASTVEQARRWCRRNPAAAGLILASGIAALAMIGVTVAAFYNSELRKANERTWEALHVAQTARAGEEKARRTAERFQYSQHITLAQIAWQESNMGRLEEFLDTCPTDYQNNWEWHYLKRQCHPDVVTLSGHSGGINTLAFHPDGKQIATGSYDGTVKLWDATSGQPLFTFPGRTTEVIRVAYSPDGKRVAAANGFDRTVNVWDIANRQVVFRLVGHTADVYGLAFSPDGKRIATASFDKTIVVWDATTGKQLFTLLGHTAEIYVLAYSPDGKRIATASKDGTVRVWDLATRREAFPSLRHVGPIDGVTFSRDGTLLASGGFDLKLWLWDVTSGKLLRSIEAHTNLINSVYFSPDGSRIVSVSGDRNIKIWDTAKLRSGSENPLLLTLKGHANQVLDAAFSPDGAHLASGSQDRTAKLWDGTTSPEARTLVGHSGEVFSVAVSPDGKRIVSAGEDGMVKVWDLATGQVRFSLEGHPGGAFGVACSGDGEWIATGGADQLVKVWNATTGRWVRSFRGHNREVRCVTFTPDGKQIASGDAGGRLKVWQTANCERLFDRQAHKGEVRSVSYDPAGEQLASAGGDWAVKIWDPTLSQELQTLKGHHCWCHGVAFSPDPGLPAPVDGEPASRGFGRRLASVSGDGDARIWDDDGHELHTISAHGNFIRGVAIGRDGTRMATASVDGTLKLWDVGTGQEVLTLKGHGGGVSCVAFSIDGNLLISGDMYGKVRIWDARPWTER
jgi:WD40 repeat protein/serine/threonine protein kinase